MDYARFLSKTTSRQRKNLVRKMTNLYMKNPSSITLATGMPNANTFPFEEISIKYRGGITQKLRGRDLSTTLQYSSSQGNGALLEKMRSFQKTWHVPQRQDWDIIFTIGSQDALFKIFSMLIDEKDPIMAQTPTYTGVLGVISPLNPDFIEIQQDADGIIPEEIAKVCEGRRSRGQPMPKLLYINPIGANPTGACLSEERKVQVYELAQKYNFLIIEDDPYYFLHFLEKQPTSLFSMDTDGRVIRLDSFSKILSAGIRLGVVSAHEEIIKMLVINVENSILHTSSVSQMIVYKLFEAWTPERFDEHFKQIQDFYRSKRDIMIASIEKHLTGLAEWAVPKGGMFVWIKVKGIDNVMNLVMDKCVANGVFVLPGNAFNHDAKKPSQYLRLCYSYATQEEIDEGLSIVAKLIREEVSKQKLTNGHHA